MGGAAAGDRGGAARVGVEMGEREEGGERVTGVGGQRTKKIMTCGTHSLVVDIEVECRV